MSKLDNLIFGLRDVYDSLGTLLARKSEIQFLGDVEIIGDRVVVSAGSSGGASSVYTGTSTGGSTVTLSVPLTLDTNYAIDIWVMFSRTESAHYMASFKYLNVVAQNVGGTAALLDASPLADIRQPNSTAYTVTLGVSSGNLTIACVGTSGQVVNVRAIVTANLLGGFS